MPAHLVFLFLFQSGLAFAFSYFICRLILRGSTDASRPGLLVIVQRIRRFFLIAALILPPAMFLAYYKSLPEGEPGTIAAWPAVWILLILLAVPTALWFASRTVAPRPPSA